MHAAEVVGGLRDAHGCIICLVHDIIHMRNVPGPLLLNRTASDSKLGEGQLNSLQTSQIQL